MNIQEIFQAGFMANHSTEPALVADFNYLLTSSDNGYISMLILLDLCAAFDSFDHGIPLQA